MSANNQSVLKYNCSIIKDRINEILKQHKLNRPFFIIDKDDHKFYIAEYLIPDCRLLSNYQGSKNSTLEILKSLGPMVNGAFALFFKPTHELVQLALKKNMFPLQNDYRHKLMLENKVRLFETTPDCLRDIFPASIVKVFSKINYNDALKDLGSPVILQLSSGHAGKTTFIINNINEFSKFPLNFRGLKVKLSRALKGRTLTLNGFKHAKLFIYSSPFIQICKVPSLNPYYMGSCGNIFNALPDIGPDLSSFMGKVNFLLELNGFEGFFGIDFIMNEKAYLIEINPRFTTSISIESESTLLKGKIPSFVYEIVRLMLAEKEKTTQNDCLKDLKETEISLKKTEESLNITQLIQYNTLDCDYISQNNQSGTYKLTEKEKTMKGASKLYSFLKDDEAVIFYPPANRRISYGNEISRIIYENSNYELNSMIKLLNDFFIARPQ